MNFTARRNRELHPVDIESYSGRGLLGARALFGGIIVLALILGGTTVYFAPAPGGTADLIRLLRFMAVLKGALVLGTILLVWRRLGRGVETRSLVGYVTGTALTLAAVIWLYSQWHMAWAVLLFYAGVLLLIGGAARDRHLLPSR